MSILLTNIGAGIKLLFKMAIPDVRAGHIGRKISRIRELRGLKQDALASLMGVSQQTVSRMEQSEELEDGTLAKVAAALNVSVEAIKNFNEEAVVNHINNIYDNTFSDNASAIGNNFNPIEKIIELYERMLQEERERVRELQERLRNYESGKA